MSISSRLTRYLISGLIGGLFLFLIGNIAAYVLVALTGWGWLFSAWRPFSIGIFIIALVLLYRRPRRLK